MGLSHAVSLIQTLHGWGLRQVPLSEQAATPREWGLSSDEARKDFLAGVIVDDLYIVSLVGPGVVDRALEEAEPVYARHGWIAKESKREPAAKQGRKITGVFVDGGACALRPPTEKLRDAAVAALATGGVATGPISDAMADPGGGGGLLPVVSVQLPGGEEAVGEGLRLVHAALEHML